LKRLNPQDGITFNLNLMCKKLTFLSEIICMHRTYHTVLTIAGSDSSGGAGIQADLKTFSALGCYGMSVITALTAQNTTGVKGIHAVPPSFVEEQIEAVLADIGADAVKIGMLFSAEIIEAVSRQLKQHAIRHIVLDPVMVSQSGDTLLLEDAIAAMQEQLMPIADVITPNIPEAYALLNLEYHNPMDMPETARLLAQFKSRSVLIKGGHSEENNCNDLLYIVSEKRAIELKGARIETNNNHGTGCTLSAAITAYLARGFSIEDAVRKAKVYITDVIQAGAQYKIGHGNGPPHHLFQFWDNDDSV